MQADGSLGFLRIPAVWMCFAFFFFYAVVLSVIQAFAPFNISPAAAEPCENVRYLVARRLATEIEPRDP